MSEIKNTRWQMVYCGQDIVNLKKEDWLPDHGAPAAYKYMSIPPYNSNQWEDAPIENGDVNFKKRSRMPNTNEYKTKPFKYIDFTYFRTTVDVPSDAVINSFKVIINQVDDGARIFLFNNKEGCKEGYFDRSDDIKLKGSKVTVDFTNQVLKGAMNTIVIVQFDDCPILNELTGGIDIMINGKKVETDRNLPIPESNGIDWKFYWAEKIRVNPSNSKEAIGEVNGTPFTYTSTDLSGNSINVETEDTLQFYTKFSNQKVVDSIPNTRNIKNRRKSKNTLTFGKSVKDPIIVFASIGNPSKEVSIEFDHRIEILWQDNTKVSGRTISAKEGNAIIKIPGNHEQINFEYKEDENRVNFFFGYAE